jgi:hypothetical protein
VLVLRANPKRLRHSGMLLLLLPSDFEVNDKMKEFWTTDADGDLLYKQNEGGGMVCPHHVGFFRVSCGKLTDHHCGDFDTLEEAKMFVEAIADGRETPLVPRKYEMTEDQKNVSELSAAIGTIAKAIGFDA